jgi:hypothetical protein
MASVKPVPYKVASDDKLLEGKLYLPFSIDFSQPGDSTGKLTVPGYAGVAGELYSFQAASGQGVQDISCLKSLMYQFNPNVSPSPSTASNTLYYSEVVIYIPATGQVLSIGGQAVGVVGGNQYAGTVKTAFSGVLDLLVTNGNAIVYFFKPRDSGADDEGFGTFVFTNFQLRPYSS